MNKIIQKYKNSNVAIKAALWFTICNLLQKGITMISMPIFTRLLSTEQYGVLTIYNSWYSIISIIVTLNLAGGVIFNAMTKYEDDKDRFISSMQGLSTLITIIFFVIYICFQNYFNKLFNLSILFVLVIFIQLLFEPAYLFWSQRQRFEYHYKSLVFVTLALSITGPVLGVIAVLSTTYKAEARIISFALVQICVGLIFYIIQGVKGKTFFNKEYWIFALKFNLPLVPHYLSQMVLGQSDRIMIDKITSSSDAAIYGVAYNLASVLTIFINAINSSYIPSLYKMIKGKRYKDNKSIANSICIFMTIAICVFMMFGPEIITIFAASEYKKAIWIFPPVAASIFYTYIYTLYVNVEFYFEKTKYVMFVSIFGAAINILLNYIFIPKFGFIAAGYTTVFSYIIFAISHYMLYKIILKKNEISKSIFPDKSILIYSIIVLIAMTFCILLYKYNIVRYIIIAIIALLALIFHKKLIAFVKKVFNK